MCIRAAAQAFRACALLSFRTTPSSDTKLALQFTAGKRHEGGIELRTF